MSANIIVIYIATLVGLVLVPRIRPIILKLVPLLLLLTTANETWITVLEHHQHATLLYNIFSIFEIIIWGLVLCNVSFENNSWALIGLALLIIGSIFEIYFRPGFHSY
jgi:hypothetical protein